METHCWTVSHPALRQSHSITLTHNSTKTLTPRLTPAALGTISTSHSRLLFILLSGRNEAPEASRHPKLSITHKHTHLASPVKCNLIRWAAHVKYSHTYVKDKEIQACNCGCVWMRFVNSLIDQQNHCKNYRKTYSGDKMCTRRGEPGGIPVLFVCSVNVVILLLGGSVA